MLGGIEYCIEFMPSILSMPFSSSDSAYRASCRAPKLNEEPHDRPAGAYPQLSSKSHMCALYGARETAATPSTVGPATQQLSMPNTQ